MIETGTDAGSPMHLERIRKVNMRIGFALALMLVLVLGRGSAQRKIIDGKSYVDYVHVTLRENVIPSEDTTRLFDLSRIDDKYASLRRYLEKVNVRVIKKDFPRFKWADTLITNDYGKVVKIPNMARHFTIYFSKPMPIIEVRDSLMQFPFIEKAFGPIATMPD